MVEIKPFNLAEYLHTPEEVREFVTTLMEEDESGVPDADFIIAALRDVVCSEGYAEIARRSGISREGLYKALSGKGDPKFSTLVQLTKSLGLRLALIPTSPDKAA